MMGGVSRYVAAASLLCGVAGALGLGAAHTPVNAQMPTAAQHPAVAKPEPAPKTLTGTLFNTREQRENLDRARLREGNIEDAAEVNATAEPARSVINGFVKRSDGRDTVWVDDVMKRDPRAEVVEQLEPNVVGGIAGGATLRAPSDAQKSLIVMYPRAIKIKPVSASKNKVLRKNRRSTLIRRFDSIKNGTQR